ncbi:MAG: DUF5615 family PIN-like protein [Planctomycetaceae bacterium]
MSLRLYMDVHVQLSISAGLATRGFDVLRAQDDDAEELDDSALLDRSTTLNRVLFSQDEDLLREAAARQRSGIAFAGLIYAHQQRITIGQAIRDLQILAGVLEPGDMLNRVEYLPL